MEDEEEKREEKRGRGKRGRIEGGKSGGGEERLVFHFFPRARRTKAIVEDPIVED